MSAPLQPSLHKAVNLPVLYVGNPVVLITTCNEDGTVNISPMSSSWALADRFVLGVSSSSQCHANIVRERECVLNFPSEAIWPRVENIARLTARFPVPEHKQRAGYRHQKNKFDACGLTTATSDTVRPPRITECPIQIEGQVVACHQPAQPWPAKQPESFSIVEVMVTRIHAHHDILNPDGQHIDTQKWRPLYYIFRHYFGIGKKLGHTFKA